MEGKKNIVFGFAYFIFTLGLGLYAANSIGSPGFEDTRGLVRAAHAHGNLESVLNIVIGYLLCRLALAGWIKKVTSWLLIVGAVFHSGMMFLTILGVPGAMSAAPVGAIALVLTMAIMAFGTLQLKSVD